MQEQNGADRHHAARPDALLEGRAILVAGGTGNVGRVVVAHMLAEGATVVVPSRSPDKLEALASTHGDDPRLVLLEGDIAGSRADDLLDRAAARVGRLHGAVASLGRFVPVHSILEATAEQLRQVLEGYLLAHFSVARTVLPRLEGDAPSYTFIQGPLAFRFMAQGPALVSIATAGQAMLAKAFMDQMEPTTARVNEVVVHTAFGWGKEQEEASSVRQEDVGRFLALLASKRGAAIRGQTIHLDTPAALEMIPPS